MNLAALPELLLSWVKNQGAALLKGETGEPASGFKPGAQYDGKVLDQLTNGRHLVQVAGQKLDMNLPGNARAGDMVKLTFVNAGPRPTFLLDQTAATAPQQVRLSNTVQQVQALIRFAQTAPVQQNAPVQATASPLANASVLANAPAGAAGNGRPAPASATPSSSAPASTSTAKAVAATATTATTVANVAARLAASAAPSQASATQAAAPASPANGTPAGARPIISNLAMIQNYGGPSATRATAATTTAVATTATTATAASVAAKPAAGAAPAQAATPGVSANSAVAGARPIVTNLAMVQNYGGASVSPSAPAGMVTVNTGPLGQAVDGLRAAIPSNADLKPNVLAELPGPGKNLLPIRLSQTVSESGLFYESHLARWSKGQMSFEAILREPQAQIGRSGQPTVHVADLDGMPQQAAHLAGRQLGMLEGMPFQWQGLAWPGQWMEWLVQERPEGEGSGETGEEAGKWVTELSLTMPRMGQVHARLSLSGDRMGIALTAPDAVTRDEMRAALPLLLQGLVTAGLEAASLSVESRGVADASA